MPQKAIGEKSTRKPASRGPARKAAPRPDAAGPGEAPKAMAPDKGPAAPRIRVGLDAYSRIDALGFEQFASRIDGQNSLEAAIHDAVGLLPQAPAIRDEHRETYARRLAGVAWRENDIRNSGRTKKYDDSGREIVDWRALARIAFWHVRRASGFGGSEVGTLLLNMKGEPDPFTSAQRIVAQKLCMAAPDPGDEHTMRGTRAEDVIQDIYHRKYDVVQDNASLARVSGFRPPRAPFLVSNPDDLVLVESASGSQRHLVDYKCPSPDMFAELEQDGVPFGYKAQLHHYHTICAAAGIQVDRMYLSPFKLMAFDAVRFEVPYDRDFAVEVALCARRIWMENVLEGRLPEYDLGTGALEREPTVRILSLTATAGSLAIMKKTIEERIQSVREELSMALLAQNRLETGKYDFGVINVSRREKWNEESLVALANAWDFDLSGFRAARPAIDADAAGAILDRLVSDLRQDRFETVTQELERLARDGLPRETKLDCDAAAAAMREAGIDVRPAMEITDVVATTRKRKGEDLEVLQELQDLSGQTAGASVTYLLNRMAEIAPAFSDIELDDQLQARAGEDHDAGAPGMMLDDYQDPALESPSP